AVVVPLRLITPSLAHCPSVKACFSSQRIIREPLQMRGGAFIDQGPIEKSAVAVFVRHRREMAGLVDAV
ncbi:MAG: hypothetical protein WBD31_05265, partial [Rubripirellula sp.]